MQFDPYIVMIVLVILIESNDSSEYVLLYKMWIVGLGLVEQLEYLMELITVHSIEFVSVEDMMNHRF